MLFHLAHGMDLRAAHVNSLDRLIYEVFYVIWSVNGHLGKSTFFCQTSDQVQGFPHCRYLMQMECKARKENSPKSLTRAIAAGRLVALHTSALQPCFSMMDCRR
jgi:hypothetical protein